MRNPGPSSALIRFVAGQSGSYLAYNMLVIAVGWQIYDLTGSAMSLGLVGLAQFLPQFLLTLLVGHVADRSDRRRIVALCQGLEGLMAVVLAVGSVTHMLGENGILACSLLLGAARSFEGPTAAALLPALVPAERLPRSLSLAAGGRQFGVICGPALGGVIYVAGPGAVYAVSAVCFLTACLLFAGISPVAASPRREPATLASVFGGITYIKSQPVILGAISLDLFSVLLGGATALLPIYAKDILHCGPWGLGMLRAAPAVGALGMSLWLTRRPLTRRVGRSMFAAVAVFGLCTVAFGLSTSFPLSLAALLVLGASDMVSVVIRSSLVQLETPDEMRGRVSAVNFIFIGASNQLGEFESGVTAAWFGAVPAVVLGGICTILVVLAWMRLFPELARRQELAARPS